MAIEVKSELVHVRLTPTQAEMIRNRAEQDGERISTWIRQVALREAQTSKASGSC